MVSHNIRTQAYGYTDGVEADRLGALGILLNGDINHESRSIYFSDDSKEDHKPT